MNADDQTNFSNTGGQRPGGPGPGGPGFSQSDFNGKNSLIDFFGKGGDYSNVFRDFEDFFGMGGMGQKQGRATRGSDLMLNLEITFMESVMGVTKEISFSKKGTCGTCQGSRCKPGTAPTKCTTCGGAGHINMRQGPMTLHMACSKCQGSGESIKSPCGTCSGTGTATSTVKESITIPKGINNGQNLRINGKGAVSDPQAPPGDLIIKITVKPDTYFKRDGFDILTNAFISIPQAVLGTSVDVKTLYGTTKVDVPSGTVDGQVVRLKSQGVTKLAPNQHQRGDHLITLKIAVPNKLSPEQRAIYEQLRELEAAKKA